MSDQNNKENVPNIILKDVVKVSPNFPDICIHN